MIADKILGHAALKAIITKKRRQGKCVAFTNGCFDVLHFGHVQYMEKARQKADILIVALNSDDSVRRLKDKGRPLVALCDRMRVVAALQSVSYVTYFIQDTPAELIAYLRPDIIIKGADYRIRDIVGKDIVESYGGSVVNVSYRKGYSVTKIIDKILRQSKRSHESPR